MGNGHRCHACGADLDSAAGPEEICADCRLTLELTEERPGLSRSLPPQHASRIGPYRLLRKVGEGGMGEVWEAEQQEPIRRKVALKLIKTGMDTRQVVARFESERQALALMDHTSVAKVFDAGSTQQGRPYFVMEYVDGEPITAFCDRRRLSTEQRLELFIQVCDGMQHAHQKGIIHRDIKASNVLVAVQDEQPIPKIIDFGLAKAAAYRLTDKTLVTQLGALMGTPGYMSPEQAELTGIDVDTRTDVYSLGVLLYQLLVGALPFDPRERRGAGLDEIRRMILEEDPFKPSARLGTLGGGRSTESATCRQTDPGSLVRALRGDLDWITMKAMEKDRTRRYSSVNELAADIRRHLRDEPVLAGPPSAAYRVRKFVKRHTTAVVAGSIVALALIVGSVGTGVGLVRSARSEAQARQEAAAASQVADFLIELFEVSDPTEARGKTVTAREILDQGVERIRRELDEQPLVKARLMRVMGRVYHGLGLYDEALPLLEEALKVLQDPAVDGQVDVAEALMALGWLYSLKGEDTRARPLFEEALALRERLLGSSHPVVAESADGLADTLIRMGDHESGRLLLERALAIRETAFGSDHAQTAGSLNNLAVFMEQTCDFDAAVALYQRALGIFESSLGSDHPSVALALDNLGNLAIKRSDHAAARRYLERAREIKEKVFGPDHLLMTPNLWASARLLAKTGDLEEALDLCERALTICQTTLGVDHDCAGTGLAHLGELMIAMGDRDGARSNLEQALEILDRAPGSSHRELVDPLSRLASLYLEQGDLQRARELSGRAAAITDGPSVVCDPEAGLALFTLARVSVLQGDRELAMESVRRALERGYDRSAIDRDPDLASLASDLEFEAPSAGVKAGD